MDLKLNIEKLKKLNKKISMETKGLILSGTLILTGLLTSCHSVEEISHDNSDVQAPNTTESTVEVTPKETEKPVTTSVETNTTNTTTSTTTETKKPEITTTKPVETKKPDEITTKKETKKDTIYYETKYEYDNTLEEGKEKTKQAGKNGYKSYEREVTYLNGQVTKTGEWKLVETVKATNRVVVVGTKQSSYDVYLNKVTNELGLPSNYWEKATFDFEPENFSKLLLRKDNPFFEIPEGYNNFNQYYESLIQTELELGQAIADMCISEIKEGNYYGTTYQLWARYLVLEYNLLSFGYPDFGRGSYYLSNDMTENFRQQEYEQLKKILTVFMECEPNYKQHIEEAEQKFFDTSVVTNEDIEFDYDLVLGKTKVRN